MTVAIELEHGNVFDVFRHQYCVDISTDSNSMAVDMAVRPEFGKYFSPGCEESNHLKFFEEDPTRFIAFDPEFILPGRFYLRVEGSQMLQSRFDFLISDSDLVVISVGQQIPFHDAGPFHFFHSTVNNDYFIFKDRYGRQFLHPKFRFFTSAVIRSTVTDVYRFKKKVCGQGFRGHIVCHPSICRICPRLVLTSIRDVYQKIGKRKDRDCLCASISKREKATSSVSDVSADYSNPGSDEVHCNVEESVQQCNVEATRPGKTAPRSSTGDREETSSSTDDHSSRSPSPNDDQAGTGSASQEEVAGAA
ncbi:hypothetical protein R1sor_012965 [Riccia sorocarpa]|uniref:Uncharacterized protein n=1 Tax=Riccia sorocarpa TaxID=122646 RepID=A0ABD3I784_9MARC